MTPIGQLVSSLSQRLAHAGIESSTSEARSLIAFAAGVEPSRLVFLDSLESQQETLVARYVDQRCEGTPLQQIMGYAYFRHTRVRVGPGVFIPRPETEVLAGWAIDQVNRGRTSVVELCAGSGAISLAIAQESRPAHHWAVELSENAFGYLVENLRSTTVVPVHDDMATALRQLNGTIDLVVANPPYIPEIDRESLPVDVSHDPSTALFSGVDGLDHLRTVAQVAKRLLKPGSVVGSEHGDDQAEQVRRIFESTGFVNIKTHLDLTSRPRFVTATKPDME